MGNPAFVDQTSVGNLDCLAFSPDGRLVAGGGVDGRVSVWDAASGRKRHSFQAHRSRVTALAFSPSGWRLASAGYVSLAVADDTVIDNLDAGEIDLATGTVTRLPGKPEDYRWLPPVRSFRYDSENDITAVLAQRDGYGAVTGRWRRRGGGFAAEFAPCPEMAVAWHVDGAVAVRAWSPQGVVVRRNGETLASWALTEPPLTIRFSGDGSSVGIQVGTGILAGSLAGSLRRFEGVARGFALSEDGGSLAFIERETDGTHPIAVVDVRTGATLRRFSCDPGDWVVLAFAPDGRSLALATLAGLQIRGIADGQPRFAPAVPPVRLVGAALSADNESLFLAGNYGERALLLRVGLADGSVAPLDVSLPATVTHFAASGPQPLALVAGNGGAELWDLGRCTRVGGVADAERLPQAVAVAPDGRRAALAWEERGATEFLLFQPPHGQDRFVVRDIVSAVFTGGDGLVLAHRTARQELSADPWDPTRSRPLHEQVQLAALSLADDHAEPLWSARRSVAYHTPSTVSPLVAIPGTAWVVGAERMVEHLSCTTIAWNWRSGETGRCGRGETTADFGPTAMASSPNGRILAEATPTGVFLSPAPEAETFRPTTIDDGGRIFVALAFGTDGRFLVGCGDDGTATIWETRTGLERMSIALRDGGRHAAIHHRSAAISANPLTDGNPLLSSQ